MANPARPTITKDLLMAIQQTQPDIKTLSGYEEKFSFGFGVSMNECYPGLYIGDLGAAKNKDYLKKNGITHVLNSAQGTKFATVDTNAEFYKDVGIKYIGMKLLDVPTANITQFFEAGTQFIDDALSSGGKVLVHCFMGISRSATISAAYLMLNKNMTAVEAIKTLRKNRAIYPNDGFLSQLADLDNKLRKERGEL
ncbi:dual specificity protein phosphatase 3-like [Homarus americanus]|uniref:protein-serine/threonine phosphatase n=1 Tax=Homarus americanus TaxID=6706 RepID=A0A8J5JB46_HOMAM|nr:dual specificity protein phosphatase 3-like [Homarus americanus]XP_042208752.1 dual specificity protein phosphatase 3-like [Homarus americanus]KAG7153896.1 Dual specificity phosphatase DUPD1-like [Homarus americanus]